MAEEQSQISDLSFEQALRELEGVVRRLESGDVPLDESIDLYERGEKPVSYTHLTLPTIYSV